MKKKLIAAGAAGLTVATVVTGLSFGSTAFSASPSLRADPQAVSSSSATSGPSEAEEGGDIDISTKGVGQDQPRSSIQDNTMKVIFQAGPSTFHAYDANGSIYTTVTTHSTLAAAEAAADPVTATKNANGSYRLGNDRGCMVWNEWTSRVSVYIYISTIGTCIDFTMNSDGTVRGRNYINNALIGSIGGGQDYGRTYRGLGLGSPGWRAVGDWSAMRPVTAISASVESIDHLARTAVVSGTATPGARVEIGSAWVTADRTTGRFSIPVTGLANGANSLTIVQKISGAQVGNSFPITVTIVEGGTIVPVPQPGVELVRGEITAVPFVVQLNEARRAVTGTTTVTAPAGSTFAPGQTTVSGSWRAGTTGSWTAAPNLALTGGTLNADRTQMTFTLGSTGGGHAAGQQWRYEFQVETPMVAAAGSSSMGYVFAGSTPGNPFRAEGSTPTTIEVNEQPTVASVVSVDPIAKTAVVSGTATPGATITIGDQNAVVQEDGSWSMTVEGLQVGSNELVVQQVVAGEPFGAPVTLDAVIAALTTSLGANDVTVTSEADGWFTEGTEGTVTITTQTGTSPTGATVRPGESLSWTTTLPEGIETGELPEPQTVDGWTTAYEASLDSAGRLTVEVKVTNATTENSEYTAADAITFPIVSTGKPSVDGTITTVFTPPTGYTSTAPEATTVAKAPLPLTATIAQRNDIAQTVVVTGNGTPGQQVSIGDASETIRPDGTYVITAPFTDRGEVEVTVSQKIGGAVHDEIDLAFTSTERGTLVSVQQQRTNLPRNEKSIMPIVVQNNEARENVTGTVTFTAPKDTIFEDGLTVLGERRNGTAGGWESDSSLDLRNGVITENGTKITFDLSVGALPQREQVRYLVEVFTSRTASAGNRQLDYTYEGTSSVGDFRATGSTIGRVASIDPSAIRE